MVEGKAPVGRPRNTWQNTLSVDMRLSAGRGTPDRTLCLSTCACQQTEEHLTEHSVCRHVPVSRPRNTWQNTLSVDMRLSADRGTPDRTLCLSTCACQLAEEHLTEHSVCRHAPVSRPRNTWQNTLSVDMRLSADRGTPDRTLCLSTCACQLAAGTPDRTLCLSTCACQQTEEHLTEHSVCRHAPVSWPRNTWQNTLSVDMRLLKVDPRDIHNRKKWMAIGWRKGNTAVSGTQQCLEHRNETSTTERNGGPQDGVRQTHCLY